MPPFSKIDYYAQGFLLFATWLCFFIPHGKTYGPFLAGGLFVWQLSSAVYYVFVRSDRKRVPYLTVASVAAVYSVVFLLALYHYLPKSLMSWIWLPGMLIIVFWYLGITWDHYKENEKAEQKSISNPDLLDDADWRK